MIQVKPFVVIQTVIELIKISFIVVNNSKNNFKLNFKQICILKTNFISLQEAKVSVKPEGRIIKLRINESGLYLYRHDSFPLYQIKCTFLVRGIKRELLHYQMCNNQAAAAKFQSCKVRSISQNENVWV